MEDFDLSRAKRIGESGSRLLAQADTIHLISALGLETLTANEIAIRLSVPLKRLWYRLSRLIDAGILEVAGERKRAGRPQPLDQCSATSYFVPAELRRTTLGSELATQLRKALDRAHAPAGELVRWDGGRFRVHKVPDRSESGRRSIELWGRAAIDPKDLPRLEREMRSVLDRYSPKVPSDQDYLVHFAVAPGDLT